MKRSSNYLKMRVLGALEHAPGDTLRERYQSVSERVFLDEDGQPHQFTWRTIQTWWYYYRRHGITHAPERSDKGVMRKVTPEDLLEAIEKVLPLFHSSSKSSHKKRGLTIQAVYRACLEEGHLSHDLIASNTFRRAVKKIRPPQTRNRRNSQAAPCFCQSSCQRPLAS